METSKMLTVSTGNISKSTAELLTEMSGPLTPDTPCFEWISVYPKGPYGWFLLIGDWDQTNETSNGFVPVPEDLEALALLSQREHCDWLCLDRDAEYATEAGINRYEW